MEIWLWSLLLFVLTISMELNHANAITCGATNRQHRKSCRNENYTTFPYKDFLSDDFEILDMGNNRLKTLNTTGFFDLIYRECIKRIELDNNNLEKIPSKAFSELTGLQELDFSNNSLTFIGTELCHLQNLVVLVFDNNPIKGFEPNAFRCLKNLTVLSMRNCSFDKVPINFLNGSNLEELDFTDNYIENINELYVPSHIIMKYRAPSKNRPSINTTSVSLGTGTTTTITTTTTTTSSTTVEQTPMPIRIKSSNTTDNTNTQVNTSTTEIILTKKKKTENGNIKETGVNVKKVIAFIIATGILLGVLCVMVYVMYCRQYKKNITFFPAHRNTKNTNENEVGPEERFL